MSESRDVRVRLGLNWDVPTEVRGEGRTRETLEEDPDGDLGGEDDDTRATGPGVVSVGGRTSGRE